MAVPFVDTDVIIRLLTGDDPDKQARTAALFQQVEDGTLTLAAPSTVIADVVYVLASPRLYHLPRNQVAALLTTLVRLRNFRVQNRRAVLRALGAYAGAGTNLGFGDALIIAAMQQSGADVLYSFDADFDRVSGIIRREL